MKKFVFAIAALAVIACSQLFAGGLSQWALFSATRTDTTGTLTAGLTDTTIAYPYKKGMSFQAIVLSAGDSIVVSAYPVFSNVPLSYNKERSATEYSTEVRYFTATVDTLGSSDFDAITATGAQAIQGIPLLTPTEIKYVCWLFAGNATTNDKVTATKFGVIVTYPED